MVIAVYVLSGLANGIANFLTLVLAGMENATKMQKPLILLTF